MGKRDIVGRIYNKTVEIKESHKEWFQNIWIKGEWDDKTPITRVEFQARREILKEFRINTCEKLIKAVPALWHYFTHKWLRIIEPNEDKNKSRWPEKNFWLVVQDAFNKFGAVIGMIRWKQNDVKLKHLMAQLEGVMKSAVAVDGNTRGEYFALRDMKWRMQKLLESDEFKFGVQNRKGRFSTTTIRG